MTHNDYPESDVLEMDVAETIPSSQLAWPNASAEQLRFMRRVYDINLQRNVAAGRTFVADVAANELAIIEGGYQARTPAAADCARLLGAARQAITAQGRAITIGLTSAYRSASHQLRLWQGYFTEPNGYYERTATQRRSQTDGEHSEAAAQLTAAFVRGRIGVPGYSNHNNGLAVDFLNIENGTTLPNRTNTAATAQWRQSWFWSWLVANAQTYNFFQNTAIDEPWHWEYKVQPRPTEGIAEYVDSWVPDSGLTKAINFRDDEDEDTNFLETGGGTFRRLREQDVHYLAFEGGGGKGFVYTGAIKTLQEKRILRFTNGRLDPTGPIKGISGASAGAITAMLLSIGYEASAITTLMRSNNFNRFFDLPAIPSRIPQINGCRNGSNNIAIRALEGIFRGILPIAIPVNIGGIRDRIEEFINQQLESFFRGRISQSDATNGPFSKLTGYPLHYLNDIVSDLGIFSGCNARDFLNQLLVQKTAQPNLTFRQHFEMFRIKLVLTGANLERGTSEYFSSDTTPNMPVADAVRISMGLPFIFKPYRISAQSATAMGNPALAGLWIDGGVRNNLPIRAFENAPEARPHTLGIRLGEESIRPINNIVDMFMALSIHQGLMGSGEAEISRTSGYRQQTIILSTRGLSLTDFNPPSAVVDPLIAEAQASVVRYFDPGVPLPEGGAWNYEEQLDFDQFLDWQESDKVPAGFNVVRRGKGEARKARGLSRYATIRLTAKLTDMNAKGLVQVTADEIDLFQRIANVETKGMIQGINTWDSAVVSSGFMQFTLQHGKMQEWIGKASSAYKAYGIEVDKSNQYNWGQETQSGIKGATKAELRWGNWAENFYNAGLDDAIIAAEVELAREYLIKHLKGLQRFLSAYQGYYSYFKDFYDKSPYVRGMFQAGYNNLPAATRRAAFIAIRAAKENSITSIAEFIKAFQAGLYAGYEARDDPEGPKRIISETRNGS